jgi:hypothetical protein
LRRPPIAVAREPHHLPIGAIDRERDATRKAAFRVGAYGARSERRRRG